MATAYRRPGAVRRRVKQALGWLGFYLLLALIVLYTVFPFYWAIVSSLRSGAQLFDTSLLPTNPAWSNYLAVFQEQPFARNILADVTRDGGFPPLMLDPVDFVGLYRQNMERQATAQGAPAFGAKPS